MRVVGTIASRRFKSIEVRVVPFMYFTTEPSSILVIWKKKQKRIVVTVLKDRLGKTLTPKVSQLEMYGVFGPNG